MTTSEPMLIESMMPRYDAVIVEHLVVPADPAHGLPRRAGAGLPVRLQSAADGVDVDSRPPAAPRGQASRSRHRCTARGAPASQAAGAMCSVHEQVHGDVARLGREIDDR